MSFQSAGRPNLRASGGYPGGPAAWAVMSGVSIRIGGDVTSIDPVGIIGRLGDWPVLLIQGTADQVDPPTEASDRKLPSGARGGGAGRACVRPRRTPWTEREDVPEPIGGLGDVVPRTGPEALTIRPSLARGIRAGEWAARTMQT
jgi:hypothetical protein